MGLDGSEHRCPSGGGFDGSLGDVRRLDDRRTPGAQRCVAEVGWWLGRAFWGRGVASRAARAVVARAFEDPQIARVVAPIHAGNERSMAVARRAGMHLEARWADWHRAPFTAASTSHVSVWRRPT